MHREFFNTTDPNVYFEAAARLIKDGIYAFELYTDKEQLMLKVDCFDGVGGVSDGELTHNSNNGWRIYCSEHKGQWDKHDYILENDKEKYLSLMKEQLTEEEYKNDWANLVSEGFFDEEQS